MSSVHEAQQSSVFAPATALPPFASFLAAAHGCGRAPGHVATPTAVLSASPAVPSPVPQAPAAASPTPHHAAMLALRPASVPNGLLLEQMQMQQMQQIQARTLQFQLQFQLHLQLLHQRQRQHQAAAQAPPPRNQRRQRRPNGQQSQEQQQQQSRRPRTADGRFAPFGPACAGSPPTAPPATDAPPPPRPAAAAAAAAPPADAARALDIDDLELVATELLARRLPGLHTAPEQGTHVQEWAQAQAQAQAQQSEQARVAQAQAAAEAQAHLQAQWAQAQLEAQLEAQLQAQLQARLQAQLQAQWAQQLQGQRARGAFPPAAPPGSVPTRAATAAAAPAAADAGPPPPPSAASCARELNVRLLHKPRHSHGAWSEIGEGEPLRVTKGKGKWVRLAIRTLYRLARSDVDLFISDMKGAPARVDHDPVEGVSIESFSSTATPTGGDSGEWVTHFDIKLDRVSKRLRFWVVARDALDASSVGSTSVFSTRNNGKALSASSQWRRNPALFPLPEHAQGGVSPGAGAGVSALPRRHFLLVAGAAFPPAPTAPSDEPAPSAAPVRSAAAPEPEAVAPAGAAHDEAGQAAQVAGVGREKRKLRPWEL